MKNSAKDIIDIEVERTLNSTSEFTRFDGNPFLLTRINSAIDNKENTSLFSSFLWKLKPALNPSLILILFFLNIFSVVYYYNSIKENTYERNDELISLMEEFSLNNEDFNFTFSDENK